MSIFMEIIMKSNGVMYTVLYKISLKLTHKRKTIIFFIERKKKKVI